MTDYSITPPEPKMPEWYDREVCTADPWPLPEVKAQPVESLRDKCWRVIVNALRKVGLA